MTRELERSITWPRWVRLETFGTPSYIAAYSAIWPILIPLILFSSSISTLNCFPHFSFLLFSSFPSLSSLFCLFLFPFFPLPYFPPFPYPLSSSFSVSSFLSPLPLSFHFRFFQQWGYRHVAGVASCCTGSLVTILITFSMGHNHSLLLIRNKLTIRWLQ